MKPGEKKGIFAWKKRKRNVRATTRSVPHIEERAAIRITAKEKRECSQEEEEAT